MGDAVRRALLRLIVLSLAFGLGCADKGDDDGRRAGTETGSWGLACDGDEQCGPLSCLCGVCTAPCGANSTCAPGDCLPAAEVASCSAQLDEVTAICGSLCSEPADCSELGASFDCRDGLCVRLGQTPGEDAGSPDAPLDEQVCGSGEECSCSANERCQFTCPQGGCIVGCSGDSVCDVTCPLGECELTCLQQADCSMDCPGGACQAACLQAAFCHVQCDGGGCDQVCEGLNNCTLVCSSSIACEVEFLGP